MDQGRFARRGTIILREKGTGRPDATDHLERIVVSAQHLRLASMNLMIAEEADLAVRLDEFIDQVDAITTRRCS